MSRVYCSNPEHFSWLGRPAAHEETDACVWPHYVPPGYQLPSMTAVETLDPREGEVGS